MDPDSASLDPRLRDPAKAAARPGAPATATHPQHSQHSQHPQHPHAQQSAVPSKASHPSQHLQQVHLQSQQQQQQQKQQQQQQPAQAQAQSQAPSQTHAHNPHPHSTLAHAHSHAHAHAHTHAHTHNTQTQSTNSQDHRHSSHTHAYQRAQSPSTPYSSHHAPSSAYTPQTQNPGPTVLTPIATTSNSNGNSNSGPSHYQRHGSGSSGPVTPVAEGSIPGDPNGGDPKKQRACESCRGLKVRCEADMANFDGPCKRCAKAGRACVVTQPTRKRQKKTDNRVAELEKKIDALTASLHATRAGGATPPSTGSSSGPGPGPGPAATGLGLGLNGGSLPISAGARAAAAASSALRRSSESATASSASGSAGGAGFGPASLAVRDWSNQTRERPTSSSQAPPPPPASQNVSSYGTMELDTRGYPSPMATTGQKRKHAETREGSDDTRRGPSVTPQPRPDPVAEEPDLVERGIITMTQANELFARYTDQMCPHLPGVVFPEGATAAELRATKPILFHAVMAAASSEIPTIQKTLTKELMHVFANKVIVVGRKSLELVQAIQVAVIWYWPPEHFEELKFYQLVHVAAVMAIDIGLGRKKQAKGGFRKHIPPTWGDHPLRKNAPPDPTTIEARRAWLTCYFLATNTSMALHRPNLLRWTSFMAECVEVLETSPEAAPTDKYFCHLVWTHKLAEEVGVLLSMDDPTSTPNISDSRTQYALKGFERELERYSSALPKEMHQASLKLSFHVLNLYMHEIATQSDFVEDFKQPLSNDPFREAFTSDAPLTPAHINAISACLLAIDGIFEVFLSLDVADIRCLPVFNFVRVAYAVVVLIKMYFAASSSKSELGKVINKDNMKVEQHLENLLEKFRATAGDDRSRPASKFLVVLVMLLSWFQKQKQNPNGGPGAVAKGSFLGATSGAPDTIPTPYQTRQNTGDKNSNNTSGPPPQQAGYSTTANTPLQLLSEVATNDSAAASTPGAAPRPAGGAGNPDLLPSGNGGSWYNNNNNNNRPQPGPPFMYDAAGPPVSGGATTTDGSAVTAAGIAPAPPTSALANGHGHGPGPMPWLNNAFSSDFDYASLGDDFAQAMDWTLEELAEGGGGMSMENGMRYIMQEPPWFHQMQQMGLNLGSGPGGMPVVNSMSGEGGMFPF